MYTAFKIIKTMCPPIYYHDENFFTKAYDVWLKLNIIIMMMLPSVRVSKILFEICIYTVAKMDYHSMRRSA